MKFNSTQHSSETVCVGSGMGLEVGEARIVHVILLDLVETPPPYSPHMHVLTFHSLPQPSMQPGGGLVILHILSRARYAEMGRKGRMKVSM